MTEPAAPHGTTSTLPPSANGSPPSRPRLRLRLQPGLPARTLLDGGWWPRSADPAAELPGLILAIEERHGPVTRIMLGRAGWDDSRPRRLRVDGPAGSRVVRLGWFETMPAGLLTAITRAGRTDLLTVPPHTSERAAHAAMEQAAQAGNRTHTPSLLAAITTAAIPRHPPAGTTQDSSPLSTWDWEGGQDGARSQRAATSAAACPRRLPDPAGRGPSQLCLEVTSPGHGAGPQRQGTVPRLMERIPDP